MNYNCVRRRDNFSGLCAPTNRLSIRPLLTFYQDANCSLVGSAAAIINKFPLIALNPRFKSRYGFSILLPCRPRRDYNAPFPTQKSVIKVCK